MRITPQLMANAGDRKQQREQKESRANLHVCAQVAPEEQVWIPAQSIPLKDSACFQGMKKKKKILSAILVTSGTVVQEASLQSALGR